MSPERHTHPNPMKAAAGRTKTRLATDPARGPRHHPDLPVAGHRPARGAHHPRPPQRQPGRSIRRRTRTGAGPTPGSTRSSPTPNTPATRSSAAPTTPAPAGRPDVPPDQWIWSAQPTHPALVDKATWDAAQQIGAARGNVQDAEQPRTRPGRRYTVPGPAVVQNLQTADARRHPHQPHPRKPDQLHLLPVPARPRPPAPTPPPTPITPT